MKITKGQRKQFIDAIEATDEPIVVRRKVGSVMYIRVKVNENVLIECYLAPEKNATPMLTIEMECETERYKGWSYFDGWNGVLVKNAFYKKYGHIIDGSDRRSNKEMLGLLLEKKSV